MTEYISREAVLQKFFERGSGYIDMLTMKTMIGEIPAADVQPVKHGWWSECYTDSRLYSGICSVCGGAAIRSVIANPLDYCPNCGARMDGEQNDD